MNTGQPPKKSFFDGVKRPSGKWMLASGVVILLTIVIAAVSLLRSSSDELRSNAKPLQVELNKESTLTGGKGTPQYNQVMIEKSTSEANAASVTGKSYAPAVVGQDDTDKKLLEPDKKAEVKPTNQNQPATNQPQLTQQQIQDRQKAYEAYVKAMMDQMNGISQRMDLPKQSVVVHVNKPKDYQLTNSSASVRNGMFVTDSELRKNSTRSGDEAPNGSADSTKSTLNKLPIHPGTLLYASNDLPINSDTSAMPAIRATILAGEYKGYTVMGTFKAQGEALMMIFDQMISPKGETFSITGYGVPPSTDTTQLASDVDHHYVERWGGLVAASFVQGLGQATSTSGISGTGLANNGLINSGVTGQAAQLTQSYITTTPQWSLTDKLMIAGGKVGQTVSQQLMQNFNRPTTLSLGAGEAIGILIIGAK